MPASDGIRCCRIEFCHKFFTVTTPKNGRRDQCVSAVSSIASFHGLIFASAFARLAFATSVS